MKLHLPKQLLTALIATMCTALPQTQAGDSISINFYKDDGKTIGSTTEGTTLFGVDVTDWNDINIPSAGSSTLTVSTALEQMVNLQVNASWATWGPGANTSTLEDKLQASYLDVSASDEWSLVLDTGDMWLKDVTFYMAGDGNSGTYDAITVNGVDYIGGVNKTGSGTWGTRKTNSDGSMTYSTVTGYDGSTAIADGELNAEQAVRVTGVAGCLEAGNKDDDAGRGSLAGIQVVESATYTSTLGATANLGEVSWSKQGVEGTTALAGIAEADRYLSVTADAAGSTLSVTEATTIAGLQLVSNNLTVSGSALTVGALHANSGTTLTMNTAISGTNLQLSGLGTISLKDMAYTGTVTVADSTTMQLQSGTQTVGSFVNNGTVQLAAGVVPGFLITNHGTVSLQTTDGVLNSLVDATDGAYKSSVISNSSTGNILIETSGNKTLSGNLTLTNGGKVTLKGGTFGTAESAIANAITSGDTATVLAFENTTAYLGSGNHDVNVDIEVGNGAVLHFTAQDTMNWSSSRVLRVLTGGEVKINKLQSLASTYEVHMWGGTISGMGSTATSDGYTYTLGLDFYNGGTIKAFENSTISTVIGGHNSNANNFINMDVVAGKTLTITGDFAGRTSFKKSGDGTVLYQGAAFSNNLVISGGVFEYSMDDDRTYTGAISGTGTLKKSGTGTLMLSSNATMGALNVAGGKVIITDGVCLDLTGGRATGTENGQVNIDGQWDYLKSFADKGTVETQGAGYIKLAGNTGGNGGDLSMTSDLTLLNKLQINGNMVLHGRSWDTTHANGHVFSVEDGASLHIGTSEDSLGELELKSKARVVINNGASLKAGLVKLGYETSAGEYGALIVNGGETQIAGVQFRQNFTNNALVVTGGALTFSPAEEGAQVLSTDGDTAVGSVSVTDATLVAEKSWAMTATDKIAVSLGNVEFDIAAEKTVTLGGSLTITGGLTNTGAGILKFASGTTLAMSSDVLNRLDVCTSTVAANANGLAENFSYVLVTGNASGSATVTVDGSTSLTLTDGKIATTDSAFIVGSTFSTANATAENGAVTAGRFHVNSGGVFTIAGDIAGVAKEDGSEGLVGGHTVASMLTTTTGTGTMVLNSNYTLGSATTVFLGDLKITGGTFTIGALSSNQANADTSTDVSSLNSIILAGGNLKYQGTTGSINNITVLSNADFTIFDMTASDDEGDELSVKGISVAAGKTLTINNDSAGAYKHHLNIDSLGGSGTVSVYGPGATTWSAGEISKLTIASMADFTGDLSITCREGNNASYPENDVYHATVNTGVAGATLGNLIFTGFGETDEASTATFNVQGNTSIDTLNIAGGTVNLSEGVTLTLGQSGEGAQASTSSIGTLNATGAGTIHLNETSTLNAFTKTGSGTLTLAGSGVYNLGVAHNMTSGVVLDSSWSGQVVVNNVTTNADIRFDKLGVAGSTVVVGQDGIQGYLQMNPNADSGAVATVTYAANIQLDGDLTITDGYSGGDYIFNGAISGEGDWLITRTTGGTNSYKFAGDISGWQGEMKQTGTQTTNVTLGTGVTTVNAAITREGGTLALTVEDSATFNKAITVSTLTSSNGKTLTFNAGGTIIGNVTADGIIKVQDGTLTIQGNLSINTDSDRLQLSGANESVGNSTAKIRLEGADNQVKQLNFGENGYARGVLELGAGTTTSAGELYMNDGVALKLEDKAKLTIDGKYTIVGNGADSTITMGDGGNLEGTTNSNHRGKFGDAEKVYVLTNVNVSASATVQNYLFTNSSLTNTGTGELTVSNGANTITTLTADKGHVKVSESMSVQSIAAKTDKVVTVANGKTVTMAGGVNLGTNGADAALTGRTDNALAQLGADATFSISDMALSNAVITTTEATPVVLQNVTATNTMLAGGKFTLNATPTVGTAATDDSTGSMSYSIGLGVQSGASLTLNLDVLNAVGAEQHGVYDITITLSGFGSEFNIDNLDAIAIRGMVDFDPNSWLAKSLEAQGAVYSVATGETVVAPGNVPTVTYSAGTGENVGSLVIAINGLNVPEPTTATLSLLALVGLAARRRRKA